MSVRQLLKFLLFYFTHSTICREISQGPHYEELQELFESFWIPDMTSPEQLLLQFDLTIIPDPVLAKYMVESFYEKEAKVAKSKTYYANLIKQPWGVIDAYPPKERYEYERIKNLSRQKWIRKFPPIATVGEEAYQRLKSHSQVITRAPGVLNFKATTHSILNMTIVEAT